MKNSNLIYLLVLLFLCFFTEGFSQNTDSLNNQENSSVPLHLIKEKLTEADLIKTTFAKETRLVSVSRSEKELKDIPSTVYVVTKEEILENGYVTLVDVLKTVPWIKVSQPGSGTLGETFFMRGQIGNEYTKILVNNVPIQSAVSGGIAIGAQLPVSQAERIEIVYGPASAVYGGDAVAGVINIITQTTEKSAYAQANAYFGSDNYRHLDFFAGGKAGRDKNVLQYSIYGNLTKQDDLSLDTDSEAFDPLDVFLNSISDPRDIQNKQLLTELATNQPDSFLTLLEERAGLTSYEGTPTQATVNQLPSQSYLIGVKFNYRKFEVSVDEMYSRRHSSLGRTPALYSYASPETYMAETIRRTHLSYQTSNKSSSFLVNASYLYYRLDANSSFGTTYDIGRSVGRAFKYEGSDDFFLESIYTKKINSNFELTGGFSATVSANLPITNDLPEAFDVNSYNDILNGNIESDPILGDFGYNGNTLFNGGIFLQAYYTKNKWVGVFGIRGDTRSIFDEDSTSTNTVLNPRVAILYKLNPKLSFRTSFATAFRAASPSTQFTSLALPDLETDSVIYQQVPSLDLNPETSLTIETGFRYFPSKNISLDIVGYFTRTNSPIVARSLPIDRDLYPNASSISGNPNTMVRVYINDEDSRSAIYGIQGIFKIKNIIKRIHLDTDFFFSYTQGNEILPEDGGEIDVYRMQPDFMGQWRVSFRPSPKWYVNFQNVLMTSWYRRNTFNLEQYAEERAETDGYYTLDMLVRYYFNKNVSAYARMNNVFDAEYGGIDATGSDLDATFNPQLQRNIQMGVSFRIN
ncbi:outer membrane receptor protein [Bernardetia litoralis DSM 6794]|uniref:Outer membrane receptor protein n=1 Tax=Bernardetia litoralis (strain ATCC 23117 / DSM 6794 / NBRC 15988 / NCIMB 1366 / Fx l1 / Sio-4) TaxID=880071 RepID=I4AQS6_BERLS|nr:TonB-dependent receptor [Bernardetia litoralis]AFM06311.1 outer membrane receptor protein [Bernardetia litoralis DSM 6794]